MVFIIQNIAQVKNLQISNILRILKSKNYFTFEENKELSNVNWLHGNLSPHYNLTKDLQFVK